jgi:hypothetical protein
MAAHKCEGPAGGPTPLENTLDDTAIVPREADPRKRMATLKAQYALAGLELLELSDGSLLATKWNLCRPLPDLYAATRFLAQFGGA